MCELFVCFGCESFIRRAACPPSAWPEEPNCQHQPWLGALAALIGYKDLQSASCQLQGPLSSMDSPDRPLPAPSSLVSPIYILSLWEALQHPQVDLTQAPFKLSSLSWDLEHLRFCVRPLSVGYFLQTLNSPHMQFPLTFKTRCSRVSSPGAGPPMLEGNITRHGLANDGY